MFILSTICDLRDHDGGSRIVALIAYTPKNEMYGKFLKYVFNVCY